MTEIGRAHLEDCNSPRKASYQLFLFEKGGGVYLMEKKSGGGESVFSRWLWESFFPREEAFRMFDSILRRKTDPTRKSLRHYRVVAEFFVQHSMV